MENKPYHYIGKLGIDIQPLISYLTSNLIPLLEDQEYKNKIIGSSPRSGAHIWLDEEWQPSKEPTDLGQRFIVPFLYDKKISLYILGGTALYKMFPDIFYLTKKFPWYEKLKPYEVRPQLIISDTTTSVHRDFDRFCAINTFLYNTDCSVTEYYSSVDKTKIAEITYEPGDTYLLDVSQPHRVKHLKPMLRIVLSWGYTCPFQEAISFIK
jgi:hypothetical protein